MLNIESWGKSHVSPISFVDHHLSYSIVSWGQQLAGKNTTTLTLSPRRALGYRMVCPLGIESLFVSLMLGRVKRFHIPLLGVHLPSLTWIASL